MSDFAASEFHGKEVGLGLDLFVAGSLSVGLRDTELLGELNPIHARNVVANLPPLQLRAPRKVLRHRSDNMIDTCLTSFVAAEAHLADVGRQTGRLAGYAGDNHHREYIHGRAAPGGLRTSRC
ncbi:hypothetical protein [Bosea sp. Root483D1]|uniref:hypothetical protein n=1 Tax=Bosea sp. Root483D1 TaxID=1736544 RepID=UPI0012E3BE70|nr:hypothetical protein [Bosea sp. Root483D1]